MTRFFGLWSLAAYSESWVASSNKHILNLSSILARLSKLSGLVLILTSIEGSHWLQTVDGMADSDQSQELGPFIKQVWGEIG